MIFPTIAHLALRVAPVEEFAFKLEFAWAIVHFWAGLSAHVAIYTPPKPPKVEVEEVQAVKVGLPLGRLLIQVVDVETGQPVSNATISYFGRDLSAQTTSDEGRVVSYEFTPEEITFEVDHPDYESGSCTGTVPEEGGDVDITCSIVPAQRQGTVDGQLVSTTGLPVGNGSVQITGPTPVTVISNAAGKFKADNLEPGLYTANVDAADYLFKSEQFNVEKGQTTTLRIVLAEKPKLVELTSKEIEIKRQINFATNSAEIPPTDEPLMSEIADVLRRNPNIRLVEIQGHTDNRGSAKYNRDLSQRRADSVLNWLTSAGIESGRLQAKGYGEDKPLVSNRSAEGRARNRRVQFIIKEREER